jgi:hypothetical protein
MVLMLMGALGVGALAWYVKGDPAAAHVAKAAPSADYTEAKPPTHRQRRKPEDSEEKTATMVQVPELQGDKVALTSDKVEVPDGEDSKKFIAEAVVRDVNLQNVKVLGVEVRHGVAVINFGGDIDSGMGSQQEGQFLTELEKGLGQFPEVRRIEIDKEGQPLDSLGHIDLTEPISVIRPGESDSESDAKPAE